VVLRVAPSLQVYFDIAIAPRSYKTAGERTLGDKTVIPLVRVVQRLYTQAYFLDEPHHSSHTPNKQIKLLLT
jgi:hypothetical protein